MFDALIHMDDPLPVAEEAPPTAPQAAELPFDDENPALALDDASPKELLSAQASTASWLEEIGAYTGEQHLSEEEREKARAAFSSLADPYRDPLTQKSRLMVLNSPPAVRHLAGMLSQYDWEFVKQAKEIRGYIVARLVEHAKSADPKISLQALRTLGTVTEIGAYTDRIEISRPPAEATPTALADAIRSKLKGFLPRSRAPDPDPTDVPYVERVEPDASSAEAP